MRSFDGFSHTQPQLPGEAEIKKSTTPNPLWSRLLLEGIVIVASILLAFALDAAWEDRQERQRRDDYLRVLNEEFVAAGEEMAEQLQDHERQLTAIATLLEDLDAGRPLDANSFRSLFGLYYFGPSHPVFTDLANTYSVDILEFGKLRYALFRYGRQKEFLDNLHHREMTFFQNEMEPYLATRFDYGFMLDGDSELTAVPRINADQQGFHDDAYFRNLLIRRRGTIRSQVLVDRDIAEATKEVLVEIEALKLP